jgi:O-antigen/teichoic acid export membrane protein
MRPPPSLPDRTTTLVAWTIAWRASSAVVALALSRVLTQGLGVSGYGRYALTVNLLVSLQLLATAGQDQVLLRFLPELLARGTAGSVADLLRKSGLTLLIAWALVASVALAARPLVESTLRVPVGDSVALGAALLLAGIAAAVLSFALVAVYDMRTQALVVPLGGLLSVALAWGLVRAGAGVAGALAAGAAGQGLVALLYFRKLRRTVARHAHPGPPGPTISWRRLLAYAGGWLPNLRFASFGVVQFENFFLARFAGERAVAYYDVGFFIPQRLITLIPSLLTGAWLVATLERAVGGGRLGDAVRAFYQGLFFLAAPATLAALSLLPPAILWFYGPEWGPAAAIAPALLLCFVAGLLAVPWSLVVRFRELNRLNAAVGGLQVLLALVTDYVLIQRWQLRGAVAAVALTTALTVGLSFLFWRLVDEHSLVVPWGYLGRSYLAAAPFLLAGLGAAAHAPFVVDLLLAAVAVPAWVWAVRRLRLLAPAQVPFLYEAHHPLVRALLRVLGGPADSH